MFAKPYLSACPRYRASLPRDRSNGHRARFPAIPFRPFLAGRSISLAKLRCPSSDRRATRKRQTWPLTYPCTTTAPPLAIDAVVVVAVVVDIDLFVRRMNLPSTSIALNRRPATNGGHLATIFQRCGPVCPFDRSVLPGNVVDRASTTTDGKCVFPDG